jgi:hypothetical protein
MIFSVGVDTTSTGTWEPGQNPGNPSLIWAWFSGFPAPAESGGIRNNRASTSSEYKFSTRIANGARRTLLIFIPQLTRVVIIIFFTCKFV